MGRPNATIVSQPPPPVTVSLARFVIVDCPDGTFVPQTEPVVKQEKIVKR